MVNGDFHRGASFSQPPAPMANLKFDCILIMKGVLSAHLFKALRRLRPSSIVSGRCRGTVGLFRRGGAFGLIPQKQWKEESP